MRNVWSLLENTTRSWKNTLMFVKKH